MKKECQQKQNEMKKKITLNTEKQYTPDTSLAYKIECQPNPKFIEQWFCRSGFVPRWSAVCAFFCCLVSFFSCSFRWCISFSRFCFVCSIYNSVFLLLWYLLLSLADRAKSIYKQWDERGSDKRHNAIRVYLFSVSLSLSLCVKL